MKLIHRSQRAREAVRTVSTDGQIFVAAVVFLMLAAILGDILGPLLGGEASADLALLDLGSESTGLAFQHSSLLSVLLFAGAVALAVSTIRIELVPMVRTMVSALRRGLGKIPI